MIEYEEFHHAMKGQRPDELKNRKYYSDKDVEKEKTLESYGYQFLRINRFNLGPDPSATIDQRLSELVGVSLSKEIMVGAWYMKNDWEVM